MRLFFQIAFVLLLAQPAAGYCQALYQVQPEYPVQPLVQHLQILADSNHSLSPEKVLRLPDSAFVKRQSLGRFLAVGPAYWARITLQSPDSLQGWVLDFDDLLKNNIAWVRSSGKIDVYGYVNGSQLFHRRTGVDYPKKVRDLKDHWVLNRVKAVVPPGVPVTLVIKAEGNSFGFFPSLKATLRAPGYQAYHDFLPPNFSQQIFVFGLAFITFLYHLLLFLYLRQRIFLWFSLWALLCTLTQAMIVGLDAQWIIPNHPEWRYPLWLLIPNSMLFTFWFFGREFVKSKERYPKLDKYMLALPLLMGLNVTGHLLYYFLGNPQIYFTSIGIHYVFIGIYSLAGLILGFVLARKPDKFARYFGMGALLAMAATLAGSLWALQLIKVPVDPFTLGILIQIVAYSFGIAYRQQQLNREATEERLASERARAELLRIQDLEEVKARFYTNLSHEFRTPLSLILGPLQQADRNQYMPAQADLAMMQRNAERLKQLVDQLLELAQLENSQIKLSLKQGKLISFIRSVVSAFESSAEEKNISLNASYPPEMPAAWYDADKLEKILTNLISNAVKYTPFGGVVHVLVDYTEQHLQLQVSDSGPGIAPHEISRIFERFFRTEGNEAQGSGIGLALTKELIEHCNGQINVQSELERGTCFKVRLPITLDQLPTYAEPGAVDKQEEIQPAAGKNVYKEQVLINGAGSAEEKPVILIAEDNTDMARYISGILQAEVNLLLANDGLQAERLAVEHLPDLVLSDVMMPGKDGYALCHALKANEKTNHIPIILLTAKVSVQDKREGLGLGADAYLTKPFDAEELRLQVRNQLRARKKMWEHFMANEHLLVNDLPLSSVEDDFLQQVFAFIKEHLDDDALNAELIGQAIGFSRSQVHRKLKALTNKSASQLISEIRLNEARNMLLNKAGTVSEIAYSVGYANLSYFTKSFKGKFGVLPSKLGASEPLS